MVELRPYQAAAIARVHAAYRAGTAGERQVPRDRASLKASLTSYMRSLQRRPAKVRAFFQTPRPLRSIGQERYLFDGRIRLIACSFAHIVRQPR
jgi:hypothetical protein